MNCKIVIQFLLVTVLLAAGAEAVAQRPLDRIRGLGNIGGGGGGGDSLQHRTGYEDSISISFRFLDSTRYRRFDSSITDFGKRYPIPADYVFLGNTGSAARPIIFRPNMNAGWDPGFHAYDIYQAVIPETRFFTTTRPYSELGYIIGSRTEQVIKLLHTQNITPDWNAAFNYNLINAPGVFRNQNTNHNTIRLNSSYQSKNRRYHAFVVFINNKIQAGENGGIRDYADMENLITYSDRSLIPVQLGNNNNSTRNPFVSSLATGTKYKNRQIMLRQQYDLGTKDSVVTDSSVIRLFYPKLRIEHTIRSGSYDYSFVDAATAGTSDTAFYLKYYERNITDTLLIQDSWKELVNDVSFYSFPDPKNAQQFIKAGATFQQLRGSFATGKRNFHNLFLHGEYRNKTRNQKWDIEANGNFYVNGFNAGDYNGYIHLKRFISRQIGYLQAGFQNVNRTPSFVFDNSSSFSLTTQPSFNKENITNIFGSLEQPERRLKLTGSYYLISNYTYFRDFYHADQASQLFNLLQVGLEKGIRVGRRWHWDAEITLQQKTGSAPLNVPLFYTRNRFYFQGNLGFKNLNMVFGTELKYHTPYKADGYSPLLGQFVYQDTSTIRLKVPHIAGFLHFRIRSFTAYIRAENLNTASLRNGFGWTNNNFAAPNYPYPGLFIRFGIFWSFVN